eukprot:CAMPEP_0117535146 /NCGR_PEP_ID=MMETSP0784-20121206/40783_1 /TAXON_ID=39447 /ORGANISM="" /LENGTH=96 /DNA_ID=CAMNT_0005331661 /DNA_START=17 /DNA_END=307 /DNA_ORIENTATION=-
MAGRASFHGDSLKKGRKIAVAYLQSRRSSGRVVRDSSLWLRALAVQALMHGRHYAKSASWESTTIRRKVLQIEAVDAVHRENYTPRHRGHLLQHSD